MSSDFLPESLRPAARSLSLSSGTVSASRSASAATGAPSSAGSARSASTGFVLAYADRCELSALSVKSPSLYVRPAHTRHSFRSNGGAERERESERARHVRAPRRGGRYAISRKKLCVCSTRAVVYADDGPLARAVVQLDAELGSELVADVVGGVEVAALFGVGACFVLLFYSFLGRFQSDSDDRWCCGKPYDTRRFNS